MKKLIIVLALILSNSFSAEIPEKSTFDKRVRFAVFNPEEVFKIYAKDGYTTVLKLEDGEKVINAATGFSEGWDITNKNNFVFIKPQAYMSQVSVSENGETINKKSVIKPSYKWNTNLIITTDRREYLIDLRLAFNTVFFKINFVYPDTKIKETKEALIAKAKEEEQKYIKKELNKTTVPRNWEFFMNVNKDSEGIAPNFAYDDGVFTYLGFDTTKTIPSVFLFENEEESILNTHIEKDGKYDVLVIHKTAKMIILRSGKKVVGLLNEGYAKNPLEKTRYTTTDSVKREVIQNGK
ncbi:P-type conjugative transfer protein VirB9 [Halarcobacter mediterraneus]|uniref:P-type conjugative transfer protein VirB9 n=1 Tax=Halarcobacter mediterraneus TaxID=2023153 RepID=A0A4Q1B347_9BACT|nr:TrbG/VirB9 family P-type conjugative transfer protein [Halarcobacter mediterraneus]RXK13235.1 P-type conjugative transfer protein VirB9 [Halarcobacter mediterraneus]